MPFPFFLGFFVITFELLEFLAFSSCSFNKSNFVFSSFFLISFSCPILLLFLSILLSFSIFILSLFSIFILPIFILLSFSNFISFSFCSIFILSLFSIFILSFCSKLIPLPLISIGLLSLLISFSGFDILISLISFTSLFLFFGLLIFGFILGLISGFISGFISFSSSFLISVFILFFSFSISFSILIGGGIIGLGIAGLIFLGIFNGFIIFVVLEISPLFFLSSKTALLLLSLVLLLSNSLFNKFLK